MTENQDPYVVYSCRQEESGKGVFYFWSGEYFTGDISKAKIHPQYADCIDSIWSGILWDQSSALKGLGFKRLSCYRLGAVDDIKLEWRGTKDILVLPAQAGKHDN